MIVCWPTKITDKGGLRSQFHHVIDIMPTILDVAGIQAPDVLNGVAQKPIGGGSRRPRRGAGGSGAKESDDRRGGQGRQ
jgi:arylsulfatase A-like enzyme